MGVSLDVNVLLPAKELLSNGLIGLERVLVENVDACF
jgi:hypothetical protein